MTKQHFIMLADSLRATMPPQANAGVYEQWITDITAVANTCASFNSAFNRERWIGYIVGAVGQNGGKR